MPAHRYSHAHLRERWTQENFGSQLEDEQGGTQERERRASQGGNADLTEEAIPDPAGRVDRIDSLETRESRAQTERSTRPSSADSNAALGEVAAPPPVEDDYAPSSEEQTATLNLGEEEQEDDHEDKQEEPLPQPTSEIVTELYTVSWLIFFSFLGTLSRLGLDAINRYPNAPVSSYILWANLGGSLFLGFLAEDRRIFRQEWGPTSADFSFQDEEKYKDSASFREKTLANHGKIKKTIPLYVGLATGFCGSFTTFSSFIRDAFLALTNALSPAPSGYAVVNTSSHSLHPRNGGYSFMALLAILILHSTVSLGALKTGAHLALLTDPIMPTLPFRLIRRIIDPLGVFLAFGGWIGAILLTIFPPNHHTHWRPRVTFALVFAPLGCLMRYYLSKHLNSRIPSFPLGTFVVNVVGTAVLGMCYDLQNTSAGAHNYTSCAVLEGVMDGFCGCLTTVSTWVAELNGLRRRHGYIYGLTSVGVSLSLMVIIMGGVGWTIGFVKPVCSS